MPRSSHKNGSNSDSTSPPQHCPPCEASAKQGPTAPAIKSGAHHPLADQWPKGTKQRLTKKLAKAFFEVVSKSDDSIFGILHKHPEFPPSNDLFYWKRKHPWFNELWQQARRRQAEYLVQKSIDIAKQTTPETAHVSRIQFDIYKWVAGKFCPNIYGDKPAQNQFQTNVNLNVSLVTNDKLTELRQRLMPTRIFIKEKSEPAPELTNGSDKPPEDSPQIHTRSNESS